ncbi:hypothetical protein [Cohnella silvisoli]|uniref:Organic solvent tolerance-like N-terminal domain-containing protein n=1 Tax=Cohnella silvisoli TaxID=2873699 RepID=A0ABV1KXI9_9BACL|nr:hypothetical protein [Cohnella silvisoli]MCD9023892.1 hypothetical protein [Cohnella silvisoli]
MYPVLFAKTLTGTATSKADGVHIDASWSVYYANEAELTKGADLVVKGTVSKEKGSKFKKGDFSSYSTDVDLTITKIIKGDTAQIGANIIVSQMGGTDGVNTVFSSHSTHLKKDQEVVLFLRKVDVNTYIPLNEDDGIYVNEKDKYNNISSKKELK